MAIVVKIKGLEKTQKFIVEFPKKLEKNIINVQKDFCSLVQKSAKLRSPRITGELANSIKIELKNKEINVVVDSPYAYFEEFGFRPHWIHSSMDNRMGRKVGDILGKNGFIYVQWSGKPFIQPAMEIGLNKIDFMLENAVTKSLGKD